MSKNLQGTLSVVTKVGNTITATAFSDFDNVGAIEDLYVDYKEKLSKFEGEYQAELKELEDDETSKTNLESWFDEKIGVIHQFMTKTERWIAAQKSASPKISEITDRESSSNITLAETSQTQRNPPSSSFKAFEDSLLEILRKQNEVTQTLAMSQERLLLPKGEIDSFDGNEPTKYRSFIAAFDHSIGGRPMKDSDKLYFLIQYTRGKPKDIAQSCIHMGESEGYKRARDILERKYGNEFFIANAFLEKLETWPTIKNEDALAMDDFATFLTTCLNHMKDRSSLNQLNSPKEIQNVIYKLPFKMRDKWRAQADFILESGLSVEFSHLVEFVNKQARILNRPIFGNIMERQSSARTNCVSGAKPLKKSTNIATAVQDSSHALCYFCRRKGHRIDTCYKFEKLINREKVDYVKKNALCFGCLAEGHRSTDCRNRLECKTCGKLHPTPLHIGNSSSTKSPTATTAITNISETRSDLRDTEIVNVCNDVSVDCKNRVALPAVPVYVKFKESDQPVLTYAVLDSCSTACFITESLMQKLNIKGKQMDIFMSTMSNVEERTPTWLINNLKIMDIDLNEEINVPVLYSTKSLPVSTKDLATQCDIQRWPHLKDIPLVETNVDVGILLGVNNTQALKPIEVVEGNAHEPFAVRYKLGWAVCGRLNSSSDDCSIKANLTKVDLSAKIETFFNQEFVDSNSTDLGPSMEDKLWEKRVSGSKLLSNNHFEVPLPFRKENFVLPDNSVQALNRLKTIRNKCFKDATFFEEYSDFINQMLDRGFAEKVPPEELNNQNGNIWYLTHHAVHHKVKKKIRVVFNCSLKFNGVSLNDELLQGPDLANNLLGVLLRFRDGNVAVIADIEKMFYQVRVPENQRNFLRFLWFDGHDLEGEVMSYRLTVHVFGAVSSPSCANYALKRTAIQNRNDRNSLAVDTVLRNFYVDDMLCSVDSVTEAIQCVKDVTEICSKGSFNLTQFLTNSPNVLATLNPEKLSKSLTQKTIERDDDIQERALGVIWCLKSDEFKFKIDLKNEPLTKRGVLSVIFSIFDPFGFVGPALLIGKSIFQQLCRLKIDWDTEIPHEVAQEWQAWVAELPLLSEFSVTRPLKHPGFSPIEKELHLFGDASEKGYGTVAYVRFVDSSGKVSCSILMAKTRLAPLKKVTVPRLELAAAHLCVVVRNIIRRELDIEFDKEWYWTDSMIVLQCLNNDKKRFQRFVANRLGFIREHSEPSQWHHVPSNLNPADCASRGVNIRNFVKNEEWKSGPQFLWQTPFVFPSTKEIDVSPPEELCKSERETTCLSAVIEQKEPITAIIEASSTWEGLKRKVAWLRKFTLMLKEKSFHPSRLCLKDIQTAEVKIIRHVQHKSFATEFQDILQHGSVKKSSPLRHLTPEIGTDDVLHVKGRLQNANISFVSKHPPILPEGHPVSLLIVQAAHKKVGHLGRESTINQIRQNYWIIGVNKMVKRLVKNCIICRKLEEKPCEPIMSNLPSERVKGDNPPFTNVGVDYFGPFLVSKKRSTEKRYGVIFTCLESRATHLEISVSLESSSFINVLRRFIARRGQVKTMRSDNGTNFIGGEAELKLAIQSWNQDQIENHLKQRSVEWSFNPPTASHYGGIWERQIRTIRKLMCAMLKEQPIKLTDDALQTLMCEIESILNSRPLTPISSDSNDLEALTPNHILLQKAGPSFPPGIFHQSDLYIRRRWRQVQYLSNLFWSRWKREYLLLLNHRKKWSVESDHPKFGDLVLISDVSVPRNSWPLGRIVELIKSADGVIRSAKVKTSKGEFHRPLTKIIPLELHR